MQTPNINQSQVTPQIVLNHLETKVSQTNAKLILESAIISTGIQVQMSEPMDSSQSESLCLALIKKGGPAFQVGTEIYKKYLKN